MNTARLRFSLLATGLLVFLLAVAPAGDHISLARASGVPSAGVTSAQMFQNNATETPTATEETTEATETPTDEVVISEETETPTEEISEPTETATSRPTSTAGPPTATPTPVGFADPAVSNAVYPTEAAIGEYVKFIVYLSNQGSLPTGEVSVVEALPGFVELVQVTTSHGSHIVNGNTVTANFDSIAPMEVVTVRITARVVTGAVPPANRSTATLFTSSRGDVKTNNSSSASVQVLPPVIMPTTMQLVPSATAEAGAATEPAEPEAFIPDSEVTETPEEEYVEAEPEEYLPDGEATETPEEEYTETEPTLSVEQLSFGQPTSRAPSNEIMTSVPTHPSAAISPPAVSPAEASMPLAPIQPTQKPASSDITVPGPAGSVGVVDQRSSSEIGPAPMLQPLGLPDTSLQRPSVPRLPLALFGVGLILLSLVVRRRSGK